MNPLYIKALHIIFVTTWFAGLFYITRLFIYQTEASEKEEPIKSAMVNQFKLMQSRLWYGITWPSMILTFVFGLWLAYLYDYWLQPWFILKFSFVILLSFYHYSLHYIFSLLKKDNYKYSSTKLRVWNEVATLFLFIIVFIVVLKDTFSFVYGISGVLILTLAIMLGIKIYKKKREQNEVK